MLAELLYPLHCMLADLLYPLQYGATPLHLAAVYGSTTCVERLLSTPGIDVNIKDRVSLCIECYMNITVMIILRTGGSGDLPIKASPISLVPFLLTPPLS